MKQRLFVFLSILFLFQFSSAQNKVNRWAVGAGLTFIDYRAPLTKEHFRISNFEPALSFYAFRYFSPAFDYRVKVSASRVEFPAFDGFEQRHRAFWDMQHIFRLKINNGVFMKEDARVAPYIQTGIGGSYVAEHPDVYIPIGLGMRVKLNEKMSVEVESSRKISLNRDFQNFAHAVAFVYNLDTQLPEFQPEEELLPKELRDIMLTYGEVAPSDVDGDGVLDIDDHCPTLAGYASMNGCPTKAELNEAMGESLAEENEMHQALQEAIVYDAAEAEQLFSAQDLIVDQDALEWKAGCLSMLALDIAAFRPLFFGNERDDIDENDKQTLDQMAKVLKDCDNVNLVVEGYGDSSMKSEEDIILSVMRAYRAKYYLVYSHGIEQERIISEGTKKRKGMRSAVSTIQEEEATTHRVDFALVF